MLRAQLLSQADLLALVDHKHQVNPNLFIDTHYEKISDKSYSYLLESIEGGKKWSRYTIIGLPSQDYIELVEGRLYLHEFGKTTEIDTGSPPAMS